MSTRNITIIVIVIVIVLVLGVIGYFLLRDRFQEPEQDTQIIPTITPTITPATPSPTITPTPIPLMTPILKELTPTPRAPIVGVTEITIVGSEFRFQPSSITVQAGERIKITFRNDGSTSHNFMIEELGIGTNTIGAGQTDIVEFTAPTSGTYTIFCSVPGHRSAGMEGDLNIE